MTMVLYDKKQCRVGFAEQSTWLSAENDNATVDEMNVESFQVLDYFSYNRRDENHGARYPVASEVSVHQYHCQPRFTVKGIAAHDNLDVLIYSFMQNVTETDKTTHHPKIFTLASTQPDFTTDAGYFATWWERNPQASRSRKVSSVICETLKLTLSPDSDFGLVAFEAQMVGLGAPVLNSAPSGTWNSIATDNWHHGGLTTVTYSTGTPVSYTLHSYEIELKQRIQGIGHDGSGGYESVGIFDREGTFKISAIEDSATVRSFFEGVAVAGTQTDFRFSHGDATDADDAADGDLDIIFSGKLTSVQQNKQSPLLVDIEGDMLGDDASTSPLQVIIDNGEDRGW